QIDVFTFALSNYRRQHLEAGADRHLEDSVDDLLRRLFADRLATDRAVWAADPGVEQSQVVIDLGDRSDGGARIAAGGLLIDGDGGRETFDEVDVRLVHLAQEL